MDAKDSLCIILETMVELKGHTPRNIILDYIMGHESEEILKKHLDENETFGCGGKSDDINYSQIIDQAITAKYIKSFSNGIGATAKGKKYLTKPVPFIISDEDEVELSGPTSGDESSISSLVNQVISDKGAQSGDLLNGQHASQHSQRCIKLIRAIDRKIALDDFAEQEGLTFDEILDELEGMQKSGTKIDIRYFGSEVLGDDCVKELCEYFDGTKNGDLKEAIDEYGDVYNEQEIRLARVIWHS